MSLIGRLERSSKETVTEQSKQHVEKAKKELDKTMHADLVSKVDDEITRLRNSKKAKVEELNATFPTDYSILFRHAHFYPFPALSTAERFNARWRGLLLSAFIAVYVWHISSVSSGGSMYDGIYVPLFPFKITRLHGMIAFCVSIALVPMFASRYYRRQYERTLLEIEKEITAITSKVERAKDAIKTSVTSATMEDVMIFDGTPYHSTTVREPFRPPSNPMSTHMGSVTGA